MLADGTPPTGVEIVDQGLESPRRNFALPVSRTT
jgi:hypothetical protein